MTFINFFLFLSYPGSWAEVDKHLSTMFCESLGHSFLVKGGIKATSAKTYDEKKFTFKGERELRV